MLYLYTDGGSRGNPGPAAIAYIVKDSGGKTLSEGGEYIGTATNNSAEYKALIAGLNAVLKLEQGKTVTCTLDSELVVKQLNGEYRVRDHHIKDLFDHVLLLAKQFDYVSYHHVTRDKNSEADALVNKVLNSAGK